MTETIAQYTARIQSFIDGKDPLAVQQQSYDTLTSLLNGVADDVVNRERAPGKWSVREILAHLADVECVNIWRYRQIIEQNGVTLTAFGQDEWARLGDYRNADTKDSLETFRILRGNNLRLFSRLTEDEWQRWGQHVERGKLTLRDIVRQIAGHDLNHIAQIREEVGKG